VVATPPIPDKPLPPEAHGVAVRLNPNNVAEVEDEVGLCSSAVATLPTSPKVTSKPGRTFIEATLALGEIHATAHPSPCIPRRTAERATICSASYHRPCHDQPCQGSPHQAVRALSGLPIELRPDNNIADMKRMVEKFVKYDAGLAHSQVIARRTAQARSFLLASRAEMIGRGTSMASPTFPLGAGTRKEAGRCGKQRQQQSRRSVFLA
jgi:hypothetical protein